MRLNGRNELAAGSDDYPDDFEDGLFDEAAKEILQAGGYTPEMLSKGACSNLVRETFRVLGGGVVKGLGTEPDPEMASALRENAFVFSGFKIHNELGEVTNAFKYMPELTDDKGNIRPFHEISKEVDRILADHKIRGINARYNQAYLRAEYNQAVQSAQMATKYRDALSRKDYINLQYRTANDERVRSEHRKLHGVTLPVDDPFWNDYTPPLGWNCRCTIAEVLKDDYPVSDSTRATSTAERITSAPKDKMFRFNPAKENRVFPKQHPYFPKGCGDCNKGIGSKNLAYDPNNPRCQACNIIQKCLDRDFKMRSKTIKTYDNGGRIDVYKTINDTTDDYKRIYAAADYFAKQGKKVTLLPKIDSPVNCYDYERIYEGLIGTKYYGKCPDLIIDGDFYEHEGYATKNDKNALRNMLNHGHLQSDKLIIERVNLQNWYILRAIKRKPDIKEVWIKDGAALTLFYKKSD